MTVKYAGIAAVLAIMATTGAEAADPLLVGVIAPTSAPSLSLA